MNAQQYQMALPQRIALLYLADQLGVPVPDQEALGEYIQTKSLFQTTMATSVAISYPL